ncbi:MAG: hypothetical protein DRH15_04165 [Deltaproteobacteria bacterium]|nr:MAG: hypothetical protein DRH15_04165 [Deltaproteobacteria bacterium]
MSPTIGFKLYLADGITLQYTFELVQFSNLPNNPKRFAEISGFRGNGSIVILGSETPWDLTIQGFLNGDNYDEITAKIDELEDKVEFGVPYYLKVDKNLAKTSQYIYRVKRLQPIQYADNLRNGEGAQAYTVIFRVRAW